MDVNKCRNLAFSSPTISEGKWFFLFAQGDELVEVDLSDGSTRLLPQFWATGIGQVVESPIHLYPNPSTDFIQLETDGIEQSTYKIYSIDGKLVKESTELLDGSISIENLPKGNYLIQIEKGETVFSKQFIKQ